MKNQSLILLKYSRTFIKNVAQTCDYWKSYDELKAETENIQQQMAEAKKNERTNALKEVKRLCKEFGFTAGMLKGALAEGRKNKWALPTR